MKIDSILLSETKELLKNSKRLKAGNYSKSSIMDFAKNTACELEFGCSDDIVKFVTELGGNVRYCSVPIYDLDGTVFINNVGDFTIIIPQHTGFLRDRFIVARELGHYFLHYILAEKEGKAYSKRGEDDQCEHEANWFAAGFLMPENELIKKYKEFNEDINRLAIYFNVSLRAAEARCCDICLN